jgi:predicted AAA+ superfamily ATPase
MIHTSVVASQRLLSEAAFPAAAQAATFLVDKTKLIEKIVDDGLNGNVDLVLRPRRCGKTTTLYMLK